MRDAVLLLTVIMATLLLVGMNHAREASRLPAVEGCLACHVRVDDPGPAHPVAVLGCSVCHGGNPFSRDKRRAHQGLVGNPGDLRVVDRTCGRAGCHSQQAAKVRNSVMSTNAGIHSALQRLWDGGGAGAGSSRPAGASSGAAAGDYYAKLCAACHLWRVRDPKAGEAGLRGGGCSACHVVRAAGRRDKALARLEHPELSMRVPMDNCVRCHNRSARIGLTYQGLLEDDGYGTPHAGGGPGARRLSGGRHYLRIPSDVHFSSGMVCIDCHTGREVMGDGTAHANLKGQLETACQDCHQPRFEGLSEPPPDAVRLARLNAVVPPLEIGLVARTRKGTPRYALRPVASRDGPTGRAVLYRKLDGRPLEYVLDETPRPHHSLPGHERLGCQACHSPLMPQCYGCHVVLREDESQLDRTLEAETPGRWIEGRSFTRFRRPALGLAGGQVVQPFSPCQVVVSVFSSDGAYDAGASLGTALMTFFDPHSTQLSSRTCLDCHLDPKSLGLGSGRLQRDAGPGVRPLYDAGASNFGWPVPPDRLVGIDGEPAQAFSGPDDRPLDAVELRGVLDVAPCLPCHGSYDDPLWTGYRAGRRLWRAGLASGCAFNAQALEAMDVQCDTSYRDNVSSMTAGFGPSMPRRENRVDNMLE